MDNMYLITFFSNGKCRGQLIAPNTILVPYVRSLNRGCDISVCDLTSHKFLTDEQIGQIKNGADCNHAEVTDVENPPKEKPKPERVGWRRRIKCLETGRVYGSIRECSDDLGISHKAIWNAINSGSPRNGLHFAAICRP